MELRQLKYFTGVAEIGNFSKAAKNLFVSQSALSQQIRALEDELGTQLFVRDTHSVILSESGMELLPLAKKVLEDIKACGERITELQGLLCGQLSVGMTFTLEPYVREAMLTFMAHHPRVQLHAHYKNLHELLTKLQNQEIDLMLSMMPRNPHDFIESIPLLEYRLMAVMRREHPLAQKSCLKFSDLEHQRLILPEKGIRDRNAIESYICSGASQLNVCSLVNDANAILNILQESNHISILAENTIKNRPQLCAVRIEDLDKPIQVYAHFNKNVARKYSAKVFLDTFRETPLYFMTKRDNETQF